MPHQSWCLNDSEVDQQNSRTQPQNMKVCLQNIGVHILNIRNHQTNIKLAMLNIKTQQVNTLIHHINMKVQLQNIKVDPTKMKIYHANIKVHIVKMYPPVLWPIILLMALHSFAKKKLQYQFWKASKTNIKLSDYRYHLQYRTEKVLSGLGNKLFCWFFIILYISMKELKISYKYL